MGTLRLILSGIIMGWFFAAVAIGLVLGIMAMFWSACGACS